MVVYLVMGITMFFPTWNKDTNPDAKLLLAKEEVVHESMTDCQEQLQRLQDAAGVYQKQYPYADKYFLVLTTECIRKEEKKSKAPERDM